MAWPLSGAIALWSARAKATDYDITSDSAAQFYDVRSPTGEVTVSRQRFVTTLGLSAENLTHAAGYDPIAPFVSIRARIRYDSDFGLNGATFDPSQTDAFVPGGAANSVDVMFAYLEGRRLLRGILGFRLGRQYVTDVLGWWSFDGAEIDAVTPLFLRTQVYGGLEQRGGLALSSSRFESDGVWRGSRDGFAASLAPSFQSASAAPAIGFAIETVGIRWIHGRLTARQVYNTGTSNVAGFDPSWAAPRTIDGWRTSTERIGGSIDATWTHVGAAQGGCVYDAYRAAVTHLYGSIDAHVHPRLSLGAEYDYYVPSFDADSVWNFFAAEPRNDVALRADATPADHVAIAASAKLRVLAVPVLPTDVGTAYDRAGIAPNNGHAFNEGFTGSLRWHSGTTNAGLRAAGDFGEEGDRVGADVHAERMLEARYILRTRVGLWHWDDRLRPDRSAASLGCVAGLGYRFSPRAQAMVEWEQDMNRLVEQRFRLMFSLTLASSP
jgi:hypothetical protein